MDVLRRVRSEFAKRRPRSPWGDFDKPVRSKSYNVGQRHRPVQPRMRSFARRMHDTATGIAELELEPARKAAAYVAAADAAIEYQLFDSAERHLRAALRNYGRAPLADGADCSGVAALTYAAEISECLMLLGIVLERAPRGNPALAEKALRDCIAHAPHDPRCVIADVARFALAGLLERNGRRSEANAISVRLDKASVPIVLY